MVLISMSFSCHFRTILRPLAWHARALMTPERRQHAPACAPGPSSSCACVPGRGRLPLPSSPAAHRTRLHHLMAHDNFPACTPCCLQDPKICNRASAAYDSAVPSPCLCKYCAQCVDSFRAWPVISLLQGVTRGQREAYHRVSALLQIHSSILLGVLCLLHRLCNLSHLSERAANALSALLLRTAASELGLEVTQAWQDI